MNIKMNIWFFKDLESNVELLNKYPEDQPDAAFQQIRHS